jgi:CBS domain-containing protein
MATTLHRYRVSAFPVVDQHERVIGVVSAADMLPKEVLAEPGVVTGLLHHREVRKAAGLTAGDLMTHPAVTVSPEDSVGHAARLMHSLRIKRLPVVNAGGQLVGIVSRSDVLPVS